MSCHNHEIPSSVVIAGNTNVLMAHVVDADNADLTQAAVDTIHVNLYELDDDERTNVDLEGVEIADDAADQYADSPDAADVVFDELQTDSRWTINSTGYNFAYKVIAPQVDKVYEVRVAITTTDGDALVVARRLVSR